LGLLLLLSVAACKQPAAKPVAAEAPVAAPVTAVAEKPVEKPAEPLPLPQPARVERVLVPGDSVASVVRGSDGKPPLTVFIGGICSNANAYLSSFPEAARKQGGVVAIEGDRPCGSGYAGFHSYSWDAERQHQRIEAALAAAGVSEIPKEGIMLVGYSQGAALGEQLAAKYPGRYSKLVIIGAPTDPNAANFKNSRGLVTMACERDVTARMKAAAVSTNKMGTPSTYFQMPGCSHGQVSDAENVFGESFDWLSANERPTSANAAPVRIAGPST
jgi:pimeloyl-ACP methyl ester carboxylesterase